MAVNQKVSNGNLKNIGGKNILWQNYTTNSSSSSFIIVKRHLTSEQIMKIHKHSEETDRWDEWNISEDEFTISGSTGMDNFDMDEFLIKIGVPENIVKWGY